MIVNVRAARAFFNPRARFFCDNGGMEKWLSVPAARARITDGVEPLRESENAKLPDALGRVLAEDVVAPFNVPAFDNSAMDGFACRFDDVGGGDRQLTIVGEAFAGRPCDREVKGGECVKIMTGAPVPAGADVIVPVEETRAADNDTVTVNANDKRRRCLHIRNAGEDLRKGEAAVGAGELCMPAHLGLMASLGAAQVRVVRRLRAGFFSTGDELRALDTPDGKPPDKLAPGEIYDSNRHTLRAMIMRMGFEPVDYGVVRDDRAALARALDDAAAQCDFVISSGGASVGEADFIREVLAARGEVLFWKVAMRPGRPLAYGKVRAPDGRKVDFLGLPGNPVSVMVCFYQFAAAALWKKAGRKDYKSPPLFKAAAGAAIRKPRGRMEFQRASLQLKDGVCIATPAPDQGSGILSSMARADCFIVLPEESEGVQAGGDVSVQLFTGIV